MCFGNLKFYSDFSLSEGAFDVSKISKYLRKRNYDYACLTDVGNISGFLKFGIALKKVGVSPLLGCCLNSIISIGMLVIKFRVIVIVKNSLGYNELCKLISNKKVVVNDNFIHFNDILTTKGLYIILCSEDGILKRNIKYYDYCIKLLNSIKKINNNVFLEFDRSNKDSCLFSNYISDYSSATGIPLIASYPVRFINKSNFKLFSFKNSVLSKKTINNNKKIRVYKNNYLISKKKFLRIYSSHQDSIINSSEIFKKCNFNLSLESRDVFKKSNLSISKTLLNIVKERYNSLNFSGSPYKNRLIYELKTIVSMGFSGFFLVVYDIVSWAKKKGIPVGPGRGSCASSLVSYVLGITDIDPLRYGLFFERFLNKKKKSIPDFDIDFCKKRRQDVINYVVRKYGKKKVFNIVTFGKFSFKNSLKDSARILGYRYGYINNISKILIENKIYSFNDLSKSEKVKHLYCLDNKFKKIVEVAIKLDGFIRNIGVHAGGIVITKLNYFNYFPLYYLKKEKKFCTQFNKLDIERMGFVKFDLLGLNTLTVINDIVYNVNKKINFRKLDILNIKTINVIKRANTIGVFQLEGYNMRKYLKKLSPSCFNEVVNIISLYRPGPINVIENYCNSNKVYPEFLNDKRIKEILASTRGIIIFQEQIIKIMQIKFSISLNDADIFRSALSKGEEKIINRLIDKITQVHNLKTSNFDNSFSDLFNYMKNNSGYCFNKAHAVSYCYITFYTAYLKAYYKKQFYTSILNNCFINRDRLLIIYRDCKLNKVFLDAPNINKSSFLYKITPGGKILCGFCSIKGIGINSAKHIIDNREKRGAYKSFKDFFFRVERSKVNIRVIKNLIYSGCFDSLSLNRKILLKEALLFNNNASFYSIECNNNKFSYVKNKEYTNTPSSIKNINFFKEEINVLGFLGPNLFLTIFNKKESYSVQNSFLKIFNGVLTYKKNKKDYLLIRVQGIYFSSKEFRIEDNNCIDLNCFSCVSLVYRVVMRNFSYFNLVVKIKLLNV